MLETYVTPILMSYVNRYIKNLKPSDLQLSLWGGDVVLNKLELRLEVLEQELKLPFTFLSGHIHELRIHVPWTKLGSEPVVIAINTIECILKLKDSAQDAEESSSSHSSRATLSTEGSRSASRARRQQQQQQVTAADADLPPGYVQSLIRRVVNNVNILVSNLILKYVEDDIVLSVNVKSAECYSVDEFWERAFVDIAAPELVLRKVINFSDCTVCLDKRSASGKIELYQDPLIYKCSFRTRLHFTYESLSGKMPSIIKIHTLCESLTLSVTDQQLPMFIRLIQLGIALYYGEIGQPDVAQAGDEGPPHTPEVPMTEDGMDPEDSSLYYSSQRPDDNEGWVSWAWSFVPAIVAYEDEKREAAEGDEGDEEEGEELDVGGDPEEGCKANRRGHRPPRDPILSVGFYMTRLTVTFKVTESHPESAFYGSNKVIFKPILVWEQEGTAVDALMQGEPFFNCQFGFVKCRASSQHGILGVRDFEDCREDGGDGCFLCCGESLSSKGPTYMSGSLFDYRSPENNGVRAEFTFDPDAHRETCTETAGLQRFGAAYLDYLYTMAVEENKVAGGPLEGAPGRAGDGPRPRESSLKRFVLGAAELRLDASSVHRVAKMVACALDHEYEAYSSPGPELVEEARVPPSPEEVASLEEFIPVRTTCLTVLSVSLTMPIAEFNLLDRIFPQYFSGQVGAGALGAKPPALRALPALALHVDRVNVEHCTPMYPRRLARTLSSLSQPSRSLLHHCYVHCYLKVFGLRADLVCLNASLAHPPVPIIPAFSPALYIKLLQLPMYWAKKVMLPVTEGIFELPSLSLRATRAQTRLLEAIAHSWSPEGAARGAAEETLLHDAFAHARVGGGVVDQPLLECTLQSLEIKSCTTPTLWAVSGSLGSLQAWARLQAEEGAKDAAAIPLFQGPTDTRRLHRPDWLSDPHSLGSVAVPPSEFLTFTLQIPHQLDNYSNTGAVLLLNVEGAALNVDPVLYTWLLYQPRPGVGRARQQSAPKAAAAAASAARKKGDEASLGSAPAVTQPSHQGSERASSPLKTKTATESRVVPGPAKPPAREAVCTGEAAHGGVTGFIGKLWEGVKRLTLQVDLEAWCVTVPSDHLSVSAAPWPNAIPGALREWFLGPRTMPGTLVVCLPRGRAISAGHKHTAVLQEIPFDALRPIHQEGNAFPWTVSLSDASAYTLLAGPHAALSLLEPAGCTSTLAVTSDKQPGDAQGQAYVVCLHVDLLPVEVRACSAQLRLLWELSDLMGRTARRLQRREAVLLRRTSVSPDVAATQMAPGSPIRSSVSNAQGDASSCSPSADVCTTTEGDTTQTGEDAAFGGTDTLEQKTSHMGGSGSRASVWLQCMLPKLTVRLFANERDGTDCVAAAELCVVGELEELSASVDIQDIYTKVKCKIGNFNVDHFRQSLPGGPMCLGGRGGVILSCTDKLNRRTFLVRPLSRQDPFSHLSAFFPSTAGKLLETSQQQQQQHGFLSLTYTRALTRNVRQRISSRQERVSRSLHRGDAPDTGPSHLHEVLVSLQPFDLVLHYPLLRAVASLLDAGGGGEAARRSPAAGKRAAPAGSAVGQPVKQHALSSRGLPLLYLNTSVIRVFVPQSEGKQQQQQQQPATSTSAPKEDTLVLKIGSISLAPVADNPLTRIVIRKDIFQRALNLGILREPGSEVEDRQYQVDLQAINVSTGCWAQLRPDRGGERSGHGTPDDERGSQNPALEWNTASGLRRQPERRAILTPLLTDFGIRVTAAPAVVFVKNMGAELGHTEEVLVCGHSLEVNVTSSLDFFLSLAQLQLMQHLAEENLTSFPASQEDVQAVTPEHLQPIGTKPPDGAVATSADAASRHSRAQDSGIGSDSAAALLVHTEHPASLVRHRQQQQQQQQRLPCASRQSSTVKSRSFVPFDVFLTASKISAMTYSATPVKGRCAEPSPGSQPRPPAPCESASSSAPGSAADGRPPAEAQGGARPAPEEAGPSSTAPPPSRSGSQASLYPARPDSSCAAAAAVDGLPPTAPPAPPPPPPPPPSPPARFGGHTAAPCTAAGRFLPPESLRVPGRSSARQALGLTVVRQPGRKSGDGSQQLEPFLYALVHQPSVLLSCHRRTQKLDFSCFDACVKGAVINYKSGDPGKSLPEPLDYSVPWLQTMCGETDARTGVPPGLLSLQIRDFLNEPASIHVELGRPCKISPSLGKLDQVARFVGKLSASERPESGRSSGSTGELPSGGRERCEDTAAAAGTAAAGGGGGDRRRRQLLLEVLALVGSVSLSTCQAVVAAECVPHPERPALGASVAALSARVDVRSSAAGSLQSLSAEVRLTDALLKTGLRDCSRSLLGPFCGSVRADAKWCGHSGASEVLPKLLLYVDLGLVQVFWGQDHVRCLTLLQQLLASHRGLPGGPAQHRAVASAAHAEERRARRCTAEHSADDLRTGLFHYIPDAESQKLLPNVQEVVFYNETEDSAGAMLWRYPEPRVLTRVRIAPVPFNTTEDPDISTADLGDVLQVPCSLEYYDELKMAFVRYRDFSLSESRACELPLPSPELAEEQGEVVAADMWRVVLHNGQDTPEEQSVDGESGSQGVCDPLVSPMALAACMRVDSSFSPAWVPALGASLRLSCLQLHLLHHASQFGAGCPLRLRPFAPDRRTPGEHEFLVVSLDEPRVSALHWDGAPSRTHARVSTGAEARVLEHRSLTLRPAVEPFRARARLRVTRGGAGGGGGDDAGAAVHARVRVDPVFVRVGQYTVHTIATAVQAWTEAGSPNAADHLFSHFIICNETQETLRLGQVDTDESILLSSRQMHQYSWRSHKIAQMLHVCIEGWGNWRWSEPFSIDCPGVFLRSIQYKGRVASLVVTVVMLSGVQKQITITGRHVVRSFLDMDLELHLTQSFMGPDGQPVTAEHTQALPANHMLPSYVMESAELRCVRVRVPGCDWSGEVCPSANRLEESVVMEVPRPNGSPIHIWCSVLASQPSAVVEQRVMVFSPLFMMCSHLPEPLTLHVEKRSRGQRQMQCIVGRGQEVTLQHMEAELTHHLTFQTRDDGEVSEAAVPISTALVLQIMDKADSEPLDMSPLLAATTLDKPDNPWPYIGPSHERAAWEASCQWESPMQVKLSAWKPGLKTLFIELRPWALLLNRSSWDLWLFEGERVSVQAPAGKTIVPPNFTEPFQLGIYYSRSNTVHKSAAVRLAREVTSPKWANGGAAAFEVVVELPEEGLAHVDVRLGSVPGAGKLCQFCITSMLRRGIQVLLVEDRTTLINKTPFSIACLPVAVSDKAYSTLGCVSTTEAAAFTIGPARDGSSRSPIACWELAGADGAASDGAAALLKSLRLSVAEEGGERPHGSWSLPALVRVDLPRQSVALPTDDYAESHVCTRPVVLTCQEAQGVTYLFLLEDPCPRMLIHNLCPVPITLKEIPAVEPRLPAPPPVIPAECWAHHELQQQRAAFPDCQARGPLPAVGLALVPAAEWSDEVDLNSAGTQVVFLPGFGCVYVNISHHRSSLSVSIAPESRAGPVLTSLRRETRHTSLDLQVSFAQVSAVLADDVTNPASSSELLRLTADDVVLSLSPRRATPPPREGGGSPSAAGPGAPRPDPAASAGSLADDGGDGCALEVIVGDLQLDNQLFERTSFHFPVLLCRVDPGPEDAGPGPRGHAGVTERALGGADVGGRRKGAAFRALVVFDEAPDFGFHPTEVELEFEPMRLYLEDTLVYYVKTLLATFAPDGRARRRADGRPAGDDAAPWDVARSSLALLRPVQLRRLAVRPLRLLVSVHASLKLYIASDHTPLAFSEFERGPLFTTPRQLVHALAMHYAAGALFRAGWVVGSLEILGSPASLVRSVGNGIADFFRLPYEGLTRGPGAFVSGVSRGTTSFVKHISKGTLTSITNLATSLARNMDRLSLDEEHSSRQEEWRRQLPESLGDGLRQGLSRLGLSLLGAIAGIVDQPIQNFQKASIGSKTKGVISGMGKGLVGVFTKPIAGAAELVSQTGYGILHGAGLRQFPKQRFSPTDEAAALAPNSHAKYVWKMLQALGRPEALMALEVVMISGAGVEHEGCLLLTADVLFVVSLSEDTQQQAFPVTEVSCRMSLAQAGLLEVQLKQPSGGAGGAGGGDDTPEQQQQQQAELCGQEKLSEQQYERLVDYVRRSSQYLAPLVPRHEQAPPVARSAPPAANIKTYQYLVHPSFGEVFVGRFTQAKNRALHKGFS
ncbi:intermembrane lipid transfer protein VPS13B isoform X4 [Petromyzon marinus]|uniref:intermembrane lipid transfer protein VPS13B isoform X4 n=1 Tax=Petromyzon marinus TaxID=7757 RepID=UPI003F7106AA